MISQHIRDRFFQRVGHELTSEVLREVKHLAFRARGVPDSLPGRERVTIFWAPSGGQGPQEVTLVWHRPTRIIFTFLPARVKLAWTLPKRKKRR